MAAAVAFCCLLGLEPGSLSELHLYLFDLLMLSFAGGAGDPAGMSFSQVGSLAGWGLALRTPLFSSQQAFSLGVEDCSNIKFPSAPFLHKLYVLCFFLPCLIFLMINMHKSAH